MNMSEYLALPAFSQGVAEKMLSDCPAAAWWASFLNPNREDDPSDASDKGSIAHAIVLEGSTALCREFDPADYPNAKGGGVATGWSNKAIREARDAARAEGLIPVLKEDFAEIQYMAGQTRTFIAKLDALEPLVARIFRDGEGVSEAVYQWDDDGVPCKIRVDRMAHDYSIIVDLKYSAMSIEPERWGRTTLLNMGYDFAAAFYRRGIKRLTGITPTYLWLNTSTERPYLSTLCGQDAAGIALADAKVELAMKRLRRCYTRKEWPQYPARVAYVETPAWAHAQFEEVQLASGVFE